MVAIWQMVMGGSEFAVVLRCCIKRRLFIHYYLRSAQK